MDEQSKQIIKLSLNGLRGFFEDPLAKIISKKAKNINNQQKKIQESSYNIYNLIDDLNKPKLKIKQLIQQQIKGHQNKKLQSKYFSKTTHIQPIYQDIKNYQIISNKFINKQNFVKQQSYNQQSYYICQLTNDIFQQYTVQKLQQDDIKQIVGSKPLHSLKLQELAKVDELYFEIQSKIQCYFNLKQNQQLTQVFQNKHFQNLIEALIKFTNQNIYEKQINSQMKLQFFVSEIIQNSIIKQLRKNSPLKNQWPTKFIDLEKTQYLFNLISNRTLYSVEEKINQIKLKLLQLHFKQHVKRQYFQKKNYQKIIEYNKHIASRKLQNKDQIINKEINPLKKQLKNDKINSSQVTYIKIPSIQLQNHRIQQNIGKKLHEKNKNIVKYQPSNIIENFQLYAYRKSKNNKKSIKNYTNILNPKIQYVNGERQLMMQQSNIKKQIRNQKIYPLINKQHSRQNIFIQTFSNQQHQSLYPYRIGPLVVQQQCSYLSYHLNSIQLKELTLRFLIDRQKYGENNVRITVDYQRNMSQALQKTLYKALGILDCLGAISLCENTRHYMRYKNKKSSQLLICSILVKMPIVEVIRKINKNQHILI